MKDEHQEIPRFFYHIKLDHEVEARMEEMRLDILKDVHHRIETETEIQHIKMRRWMVAASLALLVTLSGWLVWQTDFFRSEHLEEFLALPGNKSTVTLPDGTVALLNGGTRLTYDATTFGKKFRKVNLDGEAFFDVMKNKAVPFIVSSGVAQVKVLGTRFNVESYSTDAAVKVTLESGKVSMLISGTSETCVLEPGQQVIYNKEEHQLMRRVVKVEEVTAWRNDEMYFDDMPLDEIAKRLERRFNVSVVIRSEELKQSRYNGAFTSEDNLERILSFLSLMDARLKYEEKDGVVLIYHSKQP